MQAPDVSAARQSLWSHGQGVVDGVFRKTPSRRCLQKLLLVLYFVPAFWLVWQLFLLLAHRGSVDSKLKYYHRQTGIHNYFAEFKGFSECNILAADLYTPPPKDDRGFYDYGAFCHDRKQLLQAMSDGGRLGFDSPYRPRGCNYRWFDVEEICFILERFDGLVFIGDETLHSIYAAFNILLRRDVSTGALDISTMDHSLQENCRCANQFIKQDCRQHFVRDSEEVVHEGDTGRPYFCNRPEHTFLKIENASPSLTTTEKFKQLVPKAPRSRYRPIPIVYSVSPYTVSATDGAISLLKFMELADDSERNTPMLWIGPTAAGHIEVKGRKGNQEIWDFDRKMAVTASENDIEVLGMWNMTVQATSWDGMNFGEKVAITQAMMLMNWLSRLQSS